MDIEDVEGKSTEKWQETECRDGTHLLRVLVDSFEDYTSSPKQQEDNAKANPNPMKT